MLADHIASGADLTVVTKEGIANGEKQLDLAVRVDDNNRVTDLAVDYCAGKEYLASMGIFIISRELLIREVTEAVAHNRYHFERDLVMHGFAETGMTVNAYRFGGIALFNESTTEFYHNNLALVRPEVRYGLFGSGLTIYTKVRDEVPTYYGEHSEIDDCIVADGCTLEGRASNSVLFRGVRLEADAEVRDCVIMQGCVIGEGADLECVILDKEVIVRPGAVLRGTMDHPLVFKRGEVV